jgi:hypothetical protein
MEGLRDFLITTGAAILCFLAVWFFGRALVKGFNRVELEQAKNEVARCKIYREGGNYVPSYCIPKEEKKTDL